MNSHKKILIINQYYPPDRSATAGILEKIVKVLSLKYHITVLSGRPSYLAINRQEWKLIKVLRAKHVKIMRVGSTAFTRYKIIKRVSNYLSFLCLSLPVALMTRSDVFFSMTDPPLAGFIGAIAAKIRKKPFIYYIQDLHPDMALAAGMIKEGKLSKIWHRLHLYVLNSANRLIVIGDDMKDRILSKGINENKICVIRHGTSTHHKLQRYDSDLIKKIRNKFAFTFIHSGNIGGYGAWESIVRAIRMIDNDKIGFIFIGEGQYKKKLLEMSEGIENIVFLPFQPREKFASVLMAGDVQIITIRNSLEGLVVPSKIYPILGANKPILGICSNKSDTARIIDKYQCGLVADPDSAESIAEAVLRFYKLKDRLSVFEKNSQLAANDYRQARLIEKLSVEIECCQENS